MSKSHKARINERVTDAYKHLLNGINTTVIAERISTKYNISIRQAWHYIKKANEQYAELKSAERKVEFGKSVRRLERLFTLAMKNKNYKLALAIQREISEVFALKVIFTNEIDTNKNISDEDKVKQIDELLGL